MNCCDMKGFLSYLILWILSKNKMNGAEISKELEKRRGVKPSPGTLYPALKELRDKGLIESDESKYYSLTEKRRRRIEFCLQFLLQGIL